MFQLTSQALEKLNLKSKLLSKSAGGFCSFEGWVRNHNDGHKVLRLEYEAYKPVCVSEAKKIITEAKKRFDVEKIICAHRIGKLQLGEMAVWVGVTAGHRYEAFAACRYVIDEIKKRVPIWKKEFYKNGDSGWVNSHG